MTMPRLMLAIGMALCGTTAWGQAAGAQPHIGYLYPAGGQQGTTFHISAGGQNLRGVKAIFVSGEGVRASVVEYVRPLNPKQLGDVGRHLRALTRQRMAEMAQKRGAKAPKPKKPDAKEEELPELPDHPLLKDLATKTLTELAYLRDVLFDRKKQPNSQIAEMVLIQVTIDEKAAPGDREMRLGTPLGMTNPMVFQVGLLPEALEQEPNGPPVAEPKPFARRPEQPTFDLPILVNGQIKPGDVDRFRFRAQQGERLVIRAQARHLLPYLADAVPGWFQATLAVRDLHGHELAFADDYHFDPDPVLLYEVPRDGEYDLEVRDAIYRGREDFVYRIAIAEQPFITHMFPLGGREGKPAVATIYGWNLPVERVRLETDPGSAPVRQALWLSDKWLLNRVHYAVDTLPESLDTEPNDTAAQAQPVALPQIVNGRIERPGDVDMYSFQGRGGDEVVARVCARTLRSPLDSLVRLIDASGQVVAYSDDHMEKDGHLHTNGGLLTHMADSHLTARLPRDGVYHVQLTDSRGHGGEAHAYRLRISAPQPDFALRMNPSSVTVRPGGAAAVWVHASRIEGFKGDIEVSLRDAPAGFALQGGRIPAGRDRVRMTLTGPRRPLAQPVRLELQGRGQIDGQAVIHPVAPCEDMMQAFLWRHLAPSQQLMVAVMGFGRFAAPVPVAGDGPVRLPAGGSATVKINAPGRGAALANLKLELSEPPEGISIQQSKVVPGGMTFTLKATEGAPEAGYADNLIVAMAMEVERKGKDGKPTGKKRRVPLGVLPAIPFEIVQQ